VALSSRGRSAAAAQFRAGPNDVRSHRKIAAVPIRKPLDPARFFSDDTPLYELLEGEGEKQHATRLFAIPEILTRVLDISSKGVQIKRFKGLGEMNAKQLFDTTMDPATRQFLRVRLDEDNAVEADKMFDVLMGDVVEPRKRFIEDNALNVRNLDV